MFHPYSGTIPCHSTLLVKSSIVRASWVLGIPLGYDIHTLLRTCVCLSKKINKRSVEHCGPCATWCAPRYSACWFMLSHSTADISTIDPTVITHHELCHLISSYKWFVMWWFASNNLQVITFCLWFGVQHI